MGLIAAARAAAADVLGVIEARPTVDVADESAVLYRGGGGKGEGSGGGGNGGAVGNGGMALSFTDVKFAYPSRPNEPVRHEDQTEGSSRRLLIGCHEDQTEGSS